MIEIGKQISEGDKYIMEALAELLRRQSISLAAVEEKAGRTRAKKELHPPPTATRRRKSPSPLRHASDTAFSPEEEHLHDELRLALRHPRRISPLPSPHSSLSNHILQKDLTKNIFSNQEDYPLKLPKISTKHTIRKLTHLQTILKDRIGFVNHYFADIQSKHHNQ